MRQDAVTLCVGLICVLPSLAQAEEIRVANTIELRAALAHVAPGVTVLLSPGVYEGGLYLPNVSGAEGAPIVIQGADPNALPVFRGGGGQAFHLADCSHVVLRNLRVEGFAGNGINIDDGGSFETPSHHITLENVTISFCSRVAGYFRGDGLTVRQTLFSDTSTEGLYVIGSSDVLLERNIFRRNNVENLTGYYPAAVKIFNQSHRVVCRDNLVMDNPNSSGIWYDVGNRDGVFVNNWVQDCQDGFFFEISDGAVCAGNVFVNCDKGIRILNSANVRVWHNTLIDSVASFERNERSASGDRFGWQSPRRQRSLLQAPPSLRAEPCGLRQAHRAPGHATRRQRLRPKRRGPFRAPSGLEPHSRQRRPGGTQNSRRSPEIAPTIRSPRQSRREPAGRAVPKPGPETLRADSGPLPAELRSPHARRSPPTARLAEAGHAPTRRLPRPPELKVSGTFVGVNNACSVPSGAVESLLCPDPSESR